MGRREGLFPGWGSQFGHGFGLEEFAALFCSPAGPSLGFLAARAVGGDAGAGVHLTVELGEEHEGDACAEGWGAGGTLPDGWPVVETVPDLLRAVAEFAGAHGGVRGEHLVAHCVGDEPVAGDGDVAYLLGGIGRIILPQA